MHGESTKQKSIASRYQIIACSPCESSPRLHSHDFRCRLNFAIADILKYCIVILLACAFLYYMALEAVWTESKAGLAGFCLGMSVCAVSVLHVSRISVLQLFQRFLQQFSRVLFLQAYILVLLLFALSSMLILDLCSDRVCASVRSIYRQIFFARAFL